MSEWIRITGDGEMPKINEMVLISRADDKWPSIDFAVYSPDGEGMPSWVVANGSRHTLITHWMPMPDAPKASE